MRGLVINNDGFTILGGGFLVADTDAQNMGIILKMTAGHAGNAPYLGVRISDFINATPNHRILNRLKKRIKLNLKADEVGKIKTDLKGFPNIQLEGRYD